MDTGRLHRAAAARCQRCRQPMLDCRPARPPVCDLRLSASLPVARPACKRQTQAMRAALLGFRPAPALVAPRRPHGFAGALTGHTSMRYAASRHPSVSAHTACFPHSLLPTLQYVSRCARLLRAVGPRLSRLQTRCCPCRRRRRRLSTSRRRSRCRWPLRALRLHCRCRWPLWTLSRRHRHLRWPLRVPTRRRKTFTSHQASATGSTSCTAAGAWFSRPWRTMAASTPSPACS